MSFLQIFKVSLIPAICLPTFLGTIITIIKIVEHALDIGIRKGVAMASSCPGDHLRRFFDHSLCCLGSCWSSLNIYLTSGSSYC